MSRKKGGGGGGSDEPSAPFWMLTYGDVMTLLLTFFVLLLSFSSIQESKFKQTMGALQAALGVLNSSNAVFDTPASTGQLPMDQVPLVEAAMQAIAKALESEGMENEYDVIPTDEGYAIRLSSPVLFDLASAELKPQGRSALLKVAEHLRKTTDPVRVEGHTDNVPIHSEKYPSNWELSTARALSVLKFLNAHGVEATRLSAVGYGEFRPLVPNDTPEHRNLNRRVEIYVKTRGSAHGAPSDTALMWR